MRDEMPDEANRYDGKPAREPPQDGPTPDERERDRQLFEDSLTFVKELLENAPLSEVVLKDYGYGTQLSINIEDLAKEQGREEEYNTYFEHNGNPQDDYGIQQTVRVAVKRASGVTWREVDISDEV